MAERNRIGVALIGVTDMLPKCAEILNAATPQAAYLVAPEARQEVTRWLTELHGELLAPQRAVRADVLPNDGCSPPLLCSLAGNAEPGADLSPGVAAVAQSYNGLGDGGVDLLGQADHEDQGLDIAVPDPVAVSAQNATN